MNAHAADPASSPAHPPRADAASPADPIVSRLLETRTVLLFGTIDDALAATVVARLVALDGLSTDPIRLVVSSPGGHVESGDAIHDIVRYLASPVTMLGTGWVGSAATHVFLAAPRERRLCLPNTRFLIHQPSGGIGGASTDVAIQAREILRTRERIARVIARETGQPPERVRDDIERDFWMTTDEALSYGLLGRVIERRAELDREADGEEGDERR